MTNNSKTITIKANRITLAKTIAVIAALLCFIGLFGTIMIHSERLVYPGYTHSEPSRIFGLSYIFKDAWDGLKGVEGMGGMKFALVLMIISFFVGVGGFTFVVGNIIYSIYKKQDIKFNFLLTILLATSVQYLFMSRFACGYNGPFASGSNESISYSYKQTYAMGWGGILITIGFFLGLISSIIYDFDSKEAIINKKSICRRIAVIAIFFIGLYGLTNMVSLSNTVSNEGIKSTSGQTLNAFWWLVAVKEGNLPDSTKALGVFALIFGIISYLALAGALVFFSKGGDTKIDKRVTLISSITFAATSLISNIFMVIAGYISTESNLLADPQITTVINPGFTLFVSLILGIGLIVLAIIAYKEKKYSKAK